MSSNNSYIDGVTHRGMRKSLLSSFNKIKILDLHGNMSARERASASEADGNVFDIQQGVCIGIFVRKDESREEILHISIKGDRNKKYTILLDEDRLRQSWKPITSVDEPWFFFVPKDFSLSKEYESQPSLQDIFNEAAYGIQTKQDKLFINYSKSALSRRMQNILSDVEQLGYTKAAKRHDLGISSGWTAKRLEGLLYCRDAVRPILYRPFDRKWIYYDKQALGRSRYETMKHMLRPNLGLISMRQVFQDYDIYNHVGVTNNLVDERTFYSNRGGTYLFPLYHYETKDNSIERVLSLEYEDWQPDENDRKPNISLLLAKKVSTSLNIALLGSGCGDLIKTIGPEDIFQYMYAVLLSPTYRTRYDEFLKIDFPRVPITSDTDMFKILCNLGGELVSLHLMESDKLNNHITVFPVKGDNAVTKVGETKRLLKDVENGKGKLFINKTQYFDNLPEEVWNFHIGGYQVCYKWLADRKKAGRKLSAEDIEHFHKIVVVIDETIKIMKQIDETIAAHGGWPIK